MKSADMHSLVSHATKQVKAIYQTIFEFNDHNGHFGFFWYHYHVTNSMGQVCSFSLSLSLSSLLTVLLLLLTWPARQELIVDTGQLYLSKSDMFKVSNVKQGE